MKLRERGSALCVWEDKLLVVRLRDPVSKKVFKMPPGGIVEKGETPIQAAQRETREETGYEVTVHAHTEVVIDYPFVWAGEMHPCRTHFFRGETCGEQRPVSASEKFLEGSEWIPLKDLKKEWAFHPQLRDALIKLLSDAVPEKKKPVRKKA